MQRSGQEPAPLFFSHFRLKKNAPEIIKKYFIIVKKISQNPLHFKKVYAILIAD